MHEGRLPDHVDARVLSAAQLVEALRAYARGIPPVEAAVGLVIEHGRWLTREEFLRHVAVRPARHASHALMAVPDWDALCTIADDLEIPHSWAALLTVAVELASALDTGWRFQEMVGGLDQADTVLVLRALFHANLGTTAPPLTIVPFSA